MKKIIHNLDLNLLFQLLDRIPNVEPILSDLETYILSEGLMVMKVNSETITTVFLLFFFQSS